MLQRVTVQEHPLCFVKANALRVGNHSPVRCALPVRQLLRHIHEACSVNTVTQACLLFCLTTGNCPQENKNYSG